MASFCYRRHRFPPEIIQHAIWLYLRFTLSYRDVEELLAYSGDCDQPFRPKVIIDSGDRDHATTPLIVSA